MRSNTTQRRLSVSVFSLLLLVQTVEPVYAEVLTISNSGNRQDSSSTGTYSAQHSQNVQQQNNVGIVNQLNMQANTGHNVVSDNAGDVLLLTGDISGATTVTNEAGRNSAILGSGFSAEVSLVNSDNGQHTNNEINFSHELTLESNQGNTISISNLSNKDLNTGANAAKDNFGSVSILTGSIYEETNFATSVGVNTLSSNSNSELNINVLNNGNGRGSSNNVNVYWNETSSQNQFNSIEVLNIEDKQLSTGKNTCKDNQGSCTVSTGDIVSSTEVANHAGQNLNPPFGAPLPTHAPTVTPTPTSDEEEVSPASADQAPTVLSQTETQTPGSSNLIEDIKTAAEKTAEFGKILGAVRLPDTGIGGVAASMWDQLMIGLSMILAGLMTQRKDRIIKLSTE